MDDIIKDYLNLSYEITISTYLNFKLHDKIVGDDIFMQNILIELVNIFDVDTEYVDAVWLQWMSIKINNFENKLVDIKYKVFERTGIVLDVNTYNWSTLIDDNVGGIIHELLNE